MGFDWISFLRASVEAGTPLLFATLGEILTEKSGNLNLGVEGMMLVGAAIGFSTGISTSNPYMAILGAIIAGALCALIYAFLTVSLRANQVVTGLSLTIFGAGFASFLGQSFMGKSIPETIKLFFKSVEIPLISKIPFIGPIFFNQNVFVYFGYIVAILIGIYLYKTSFGLALRTVGESPAAADAVGISVSLYKYIHILIGGALCALGGAYLSLVYIPAWQDNVTAGRGWIAVALVIFVTWNPYKAIWGSYLFGGLSILGFWLQKYNLPVSQYFLDMLPYAATVIMLIVQSMKQSKENLSPKSLGLSYFREER